MKPRFRSLRRLGPLLAAGLLAVAVLAGCEREEPDLGGASSEPGAGQAESTEEAPTTEEIPGGADPAETRVIDEWTRALSRGDVAAAARLFAIPSVAQNGPALIRIRDAADARLFNASLPCGARLIDATPEGKFVVATFELSERPGGDCGSGAGETARTAFEIEDGEIVEWRRVADGRGPAPGNPV